MLLRMLPNNERLPLNSINAHRQLRRFWPEYQKPMDARALDAKFTFWDLKRAANVDLELKKFLSIIGID